MASQPCLSRPPSTHNTLSAVLLSGRGLPLVAMLCVATVHPRSAARRYHLVLRSFAKNPQFSTKRIPKNRPDSPVFTRKFAPQSLFVPLNFEERIPADRPPRPRSFPGGRRCGLPSRKGVLPARNFEERMLAYGSRSVIRNLRPSITDRQFMVFSSCSFVYLVVKLCSPQEPFEPYLNYFAFRDATSRRPRASGAVARGVYPAQRRADQARLPIQLPNYPTN